MVACYHRRHHGPIPDIGPPGLAPGPALQRVCLTASKHNRTQLSASYEARASEPMLTTVILQSLSW
jgi:hypothetical protein